MSAQEEKLPAAVEALSLEEIAALVEKDPANAELRDELAYAHLDRYLYGTDEQDGGDESDIEAIRKILNDLAETLGLLPRAYISYIDDKPNEAAEWLAKYAVDLTKEGEPISCDILFADFIDPFGRAPVQFWTRLSELVDVNCPESAFSYTLRGISLLESDNVDGGMARYLQALEKDQSYWLPARNLASLYADEKNWESAAIYYEKALESETARQIAEIHFEYGWCLGTLKRHAEEAKHYRVCMKIDPKFPDALNNYGWSLYKQGKYEKALKILDKAIKKGDGGKYAYRNRAQTLTKMKRYKEAIEAWKAAGKQGSLSKSIQTRIDRLSQIALNETTEVETIETITTINDSEGDEDEMLPQTKMPAGTRIHLASSLRLSVHFEQLLEDMVERLINEGEEIFGRTLRIYESSRGLRGRQFIIPGHGRIDLLAVDSQNGDFVVIELKRDESHETVVGQISMYMTWVREHLAKGQNVFGVICVFTASEKLKLAARSVPGLEVFEYDLHFRKV